MREAPYLASFRQIDIRTLDGPCSLYVYVHDEGDTWEAGPPLPSPTDSCAAVTIEGDAGGLLCHAGNGAFLYRNAAWAGVAGEFPMGAALGAVLLG